MHGAAPGAQIVSARACTWNGGCTAVALTEGMIDLVVNRHVDVVNVSIGGLRALNDDSDAIAQLYGELIRRYGVQIVVSAGNDGPGVNTVSSPSTGNGVISVAVSVSKRTWWSNYGAEVRAGQSIFGFSSRGPGEDGSLKPTVAAPGSAVPAIPAWLDGQALPEAGYHLPPGYAMYNGISMAAPQVTGASALLLSGAKATGVAAPAPSLRTALTDTARLIGDLPTAAQGAGLIDVSAAWDLLARGITTAGYDVQAPVCTALSAYLTTPGTGTGVYNRCLPEAGGQRVRCYTNYSDPASCDPDDRAYPTPTPGVWEFQVEARRTSPLPDNDSVPGSPCRAPSCRRRRSGFRRSRSTSRQTRPTRPPTPGARSPRGPRRASWAGCATCGVRSPTARRPPPRSRCRATPRDSS
ncbi:S8 family serine peptidase [Micromonospora sp. NPDC047548]|uniref:S8 family serine peptidase n=1 Tax=Micromonospora sp. NPDC047548 TaxID=3155624 RepID=UPI0033D83D81